MIHERKTTKTHEIFWQHMKSVCPEMQSSKQVLIVTDQEKSIIEAIHRSFPEMPHFLCWNHILQDCKRWLRSHGLHSADEMNYYIDTVRSLLQSNTEAEYKDALLSLTAKWSQPFTDYFIKNIHSVIGKLGSWVLQQHGLAEITGNQSEAYNSVIKRLQEWKEAPLDSMVLSLYRLVQFSLVEACRGRKNLGDYELKPELKIVYEDDDAPIVAAIAPEAIIQRIRDGLREELEATSLEIPQNVSSSEIPQSVASEVPLHASSIERSNHIIERGQIPWTQDWVYLL